MALNSAVTIDGGDISLLQDGLDWLQAKTGKPVLGVINYLQGLHLEAEDAIDRDADELERALDLERIKSWLIDQRFLRVMLAEAGKRGHADAFFVVFDMAIDAIDTGNIFPGQHFANAATAIELAVVEQVQPVAESSRQAQIMQHHDRGTIFSRMVAQNFHHV